MNDQQTPVQEPPDELEAVTMVATAHSRHEWMYLAERVFSHPRYALLIVAALALCMFERYWFVIAPLTLFFSAELALRIWLQKEQGWCNRNEMLFITLDALATLGLYLILLAPTGIFGHTIYLRLLRLLRGIYMLRMLRVFSFLTFEGFVYSLRLALLAIILCFVALGVETVTNYIAVLLLVELAARTLAIGKVLPDGGRKQGEYCFIAFDFIATLALFNIIESVPQALVLLRLIRILVMLNPLGSLIVAIKKVAQMHEVRKESGMLLSMLVILLSFSGSLIYFIYPQMDLSGDGLINGGDHTVMQVILFAFTWLVDPGLTPKVAFSAGLVLLSMFVAMTGVFFFALLVGLGTNVMGGLLHELTNSPLSARVQLLFSGDNEKAEMILKTFAAMCARMRRSYFSVWLFFDKEDRMLSGFGNWLNIRQVDAGSRDVLAHFKLSGISEMIYFHRRFNHPESIVDHHALVQEAGQKQQYLGISLFSQSGLAEKLENTYVQTMGAESFNSSSIAARMLYQMHHCAFMPELGTEMLDAVDGETGLFTVSWQARIQTGENGALLCNGSRQLLLAEWATTLFSSGVNALAIRNETGEFHLLSDMVNTGKTVEIVDIIALGREPGLWPGLMEQALKRPEAAVRNKALKTFEWPDAWELNLLFIGWHEGLPTMIEEMAGKHHKLTVNILNPSEQNNLEHQQQWLDAVGGKVTESGQCELHLHMQPWDGLDISQVTPLLRGCKVIMLYPTGDRDHGEDSLLEMWYHSLASLLTARKQEVKWWTPPKIMILPRNRSNSDTFIKSSERYPLLNIDIGSPDTFHDVYMARKILSFAKRQADPKGFEQECKTFEFINMLLSDAVLVESESVERLLENDDVTWQEVYHEGLRRGWVPVAYGLDISRHSRRDFYNLVDRLFPIERAVTGGQLNILAGAQIDEFEMPASTAVTLFCRRGLLLKEDEQAEAAVEEQVEEQIEEQIEEQVEEQVEEQQRELATSVLEGEVMQEIWPKSADPRLLRVLTRQVEGALHLLNESTENGLMKIMVVLEKEAGTEVEADIMDALTDLQNIDRVSQRLNNVMSCLDEWSQAVKDQDSGDATWKDAVADRYVMEEERLVLRDEL